MELPTVGKFADRSNLPLYRNYEALSNCSKLTSAAVSAWFVVGFDRLCQVYKLTVLRLKQLPQTKPAPVSLPLLESVA